MVNFYYYLKIQTYDTEYLNQLKPREMILLKVKRKLLQIVDQTEQQGKIQQYIYLHYIA
jgi:hypothetical protein